MSDSANMSDSENARDDERLDASRIPMIDDDGANDVAEAVAGANAADAEVADPFDGEYAHPARAQYVRQRPPHRTQGVIDDLANDGMSSSSYTHESNVAVGGGAFSGGSSYRRSRKNHQQIKRGRGQYGQYLEIPKGRRSIFASRERSRRRKSIAAAFVVLALLAGAAWFIWNMMNSIQLP